MPLEVTRPTLAVLHPLAEHVTAHVVQRPQRMSDARVFVCGSSLPIPRSSAGQVATMRNRREIFDAYTVEE